jgi:multicomponent Na+:H+ antiporter subunit B
MADDRLYTDSVVVTRTVRAVVPFVITYGIFTMLHGTKSVGGGFQGGVVVAAGVVTLAFAFGVGQTRAALDPRLLAGVAAGGLGLFAVVAAASLALGGAFLDAAVYAGLSIPGAAVYAVELVEVGIGLTVASVIVVMFLTIARAEP